MDKQSTHLHTNRSQHCHSSQICNYTTHTQIQQFRISTFKTSENLFIKRHYIPQQIFHHLLIHQSQKFAKHFSCYKILMLNFYSLYLCLPHCLSPFSLTVCLSVCLSLSLSLSLTLSLSLFLSLTLYLSGTNPARLTFTPSTNYNWAVTIGDEDFIFLSFSPITLVCDYWIKSCCLWGDCNTYSLLQG